MPLYAVGGGGTGTDSGLVSMPITAGVAAMDVVYMKADGTVDKADASSMPSGRAFGIVESVGGGLASVRVFGEMPGFSGLTPGRVYIVSKSPGGFVWDGDTGSPNYPTAPGEVIHEVMIATASDRAYVGTQRDLEVI